MIKPMKKTIFYVAIAFSLYVIAATFQSDFWGDLLAPVCDLLATGIIFYSAYTSDNPKFKPNFTLLGISVLLWASADILWLVYNLIFHINPNNSELISILYFGTNIFLLIETILYCTYRFRKWDTVQLILDAVFISVAILWLLWVLLFDKSYNALGILVKYDIINTLSIATDLVQMLVTAIWYISVRKGKMPVSFLILKGSVFWYSIVDLIYFYLYAKNLYIPNSLMDVCYLATLMGIAIATKLFYVQYPFFYDTQKEYSNIGYRHKGLVLILAPILILIFKGFDLFDICFLAVLIFLYEGLSSYIQTAIGNKKLLNRELALNSELERLVSERTHDLEQKNDELRQKNTELKYITDHDPLTGLYNRKYFLQKLDDKIKNIALNKKLVLVLWNVDRLKGINDTYGHSIGDQILIRLAKRFNYIQGNMGLLARLGGDEFAFAIEEESQNEEYVNIAKRIVNACSEPIQIGEYTFHVSISVGVSLFPLSALNADMLLKNADVAMHHAKGTGFGNCISLYKEIDSAVKRKHLIVSFLKAADYNRDFSLNYQPQFRVTDQKLVGMEALLRWNCPELGPVAPAEFIPIAEKENLIIPIGNWVIENAVSQISIWNRAYHTNWRMGINISPKQLDQASFFAIMNSSIQRYKAAFEWIDIEITEGIALDNEDKAASIKKYFNNKGISISIDDFGTGYSSLGYLNMLSFDRLKIAKPLIDKITTDEPSLKIVSSIIMLAKSLGIQTISEGVETKKQFDLLFDLGCDQIQGFYLGKPLPSKSFQEAFLIDDHIKCKNQSFKTSKARMVI